MRKKHNRAGRLRFQSKDVLYEVISKVKFRHRTISYKTFYSPDGGFSKEQVLERAKMNIERKFDNSSGRILELYIGSIYR